MDKPLTVWGVTRHYPGDSCDEDVSMHRRRESARQRAKELMEDAIDGFDAIGRKHGGSFWSLDQTPESIAVKDPFGLVMLKFLIYPVEVEP